MPRWKTDRNYLFNDKWPIQNLACRLVCGMIKIPSAVCENICPSGDMLCNAIHDVFVVF